MRQKRRPARCPAPGDHRDRPRFLGTRRWLRRRIGVDGWLRRHDDRRRPREHICFGLPLTEAVQPAAEGAQKVSGDCGTGVAIIGVFEVFGRLLFGAVAGGFGGGLVSMLLYAVMTRLHRQRTVRPGVGIGGYTREQGHSLDLLSLDQIVPVIKARRKNED